MDKAKITPEVQAALAEPVDDGWPAAEAHYDRALDLARGLRDPAGEARVLRLYGAAAYDHLQVERSEALLREARTRAEEGGWESETLLAMNHLGATLRKRGKLDQAARVFEEGLARAHPRDFHFERARLMGNYGALMDDLGDLGGAAELYGRYEELLGLLPDPPLDRLANAHGLVSRVYRQRGDFDRALVKAQSEQRLGEQSGDAYREARGWQHIAQAQADLGDVAAAEQSYLQATDVLKRSSYLRAHLSLAHAHGRFYLGLGRLHQAQAMVDRAVQQLRSLSAEEDEHRAKVAQLAAEVAAAAGLHGEALWHLREALEAQVRRYENLSAPELLRRTRGRREELARLGEQLSREAAQVNRDESELEPVRELLGKLGVGPATPVPPEDVTSWRERIGEVSRERWAKLLPATLTKSTRTDLVLADLLSHGQVGDLPRSLFLILATLERELRERVYKVPRTSETHRSESVPGPERWGLVRLVDGLDASGVEAQVVLCVKRVLEQPVALSGPVPITASQLRNDVAHGRLPDLSRVEADAIRRMLVLGEDAVLPRVVGLE